MMRAPFRSLSRQASRTNRVTILVLGVVLLVLGVCGIWYWRHVETQTLLIQERNFRALTVTSRALREVVTNYESVFRSVIEGKPPCNNMDPCPEKDRRAAYTAAINALSVEGLQAGRDVRPFDEVKVIKEQYEDEGFAVKFIYHDGKCSIKLTYVHSDPVQTKWKITAVMDIGPIMKQLVTEDIFSDVLLADRRGQVLYHHPSKHDPSGFEFEDVSSLLHRLNGSESKGDGKEGGTERNEDLVSTLPLFNEAPVGGVVHAIFAQATDLPADRGTAQTLILVGIIPAGQFHAESRAIALNVLLVMVGLTLGLFFALPYVKLRTNASTERLTRISITVLIVSSILGVAVLTFGLADIATYRNLEQHLNARLKDVSDEIRKQFNDDAQRGLEQLVEFDQPCRNGGGCLSYPKIGNPYYDHLGQLLCIGKNKDGKEKRFSFYPAALNNCSGNGNATPETEAGYRDVVSIFWVGQEGELKAFWSRDLYPWKYVNLKEREYVRRILADETLVREHDGQKFWIQPIYSRTTGDNAAVFSMKSTTSSEGPIVTALEVKLPSVTGAAVPPGLGFAVIDQEGEVLFHSDARRNLRENLFEETDRDGRLRQTVFARVDAEFDGRYWGKDRHFHLTPLFSRTIGESPDVHWSLVTYWDIDMLRDLNLRALYSSGALFLIYGIIVFSIAIPVWWISSHANETAYRWVWPQSEHLHGYQIAMLFLVLSLIAVCIWYLRPHPAPEMLLWGLLPALASAVVVLSISHTKPQLTDHNGTRVSAQPNYRLSYALVGTLALLVFVVIPALMIFRVAIDVEWRLLAKFSLYDLEQDRDLQAQKVRQSYPSALFGDSQDKSEIRSGFLEKFSEQNVAYADFPFKRCGQKNENQSEDCRDASTSVVQRGDERLIQWLYQVIERPRIAQGRDGTDRFLEEPQLYYLKDLKWHGLRFESGSGTLRLGDRSHVVPSPIPVWLYSLLVCSGLIPLAVLQPKKIHALATVICVLGAFLLFGLVGQSLAVLGVCALFYGACYVLPTFAAQRVLFLDFPYPLMGSRPTGNMQGDYGPHEKPSFGSAGLWRIFLKEMSALPNELCLVDQPTFREKILKQDINDDFGIVKEQIIRELLEKLTQYYLQIWEKCTESQRRALFNLARDGFLHSRNPDIGQLLKSGLIVADLNLRPMNESFRRFVIRTGLKERLDEGIAQARSGAWFQVWRPIGVGLVLIMVFLVLTQEQYRAITLAFLGVLPALLGALSQTLTAPKKEKVDTASPA